MWFDAQHEYKDLTNEVFRTSPVPFAKGRTGNLFKARWKNSGNKLVALTFLHTLDYKKIVLGKRLTHENIVSFLGTFNDAGPHVALVAPFFYDSPVPVYLRRNPRKNRFTLIYGVAKGLEFLHRENIVHGALTANKILIDRHGVPRVYGFDTLQILSSEGPVDISKGPFRHMSPELLRYLFPEMFPHDLSVDESAVSSAEPTKASDVYAFSMVIFEIFTLKLPFYYLHHDWPVIQDVIKERRPQREEDPAFTNNELWALMNKCWATYPQSRPGMDDVCAQLQKISPISHPSAFQVAVMTGLGTLKTAIGDIENVLVPHSKLDILFNLPRAKKEERTPALDITGKIQRTDSFPFGTKNCLIYNGKFNSGDQAPVIIKILRSPDHGLLEQEVIRRRLNRESQIWASLKHENVLEFWGICRDIGPTSAALISPYCKRGNLSKYLEDNPSANRKAIAIGFSNGLQYLHSQEIAHGDLKPQNILISDQHVPLICDFGLSKIMTTKGHTTGFTGSPAYMAPEQFQIQERQEGDPDSRVAIVTMQADIYSFGLVTLEILSKLKARSALTRFALLMTPEQCQSLVPTREGYPRSIVNEDLWLLYQDCWKVEPESRPTMAEIGPRLVRVVGAISRA